VADPEQAHAAARWRQGLAAIEGRARRMHGVAFLQTSPAARIEILTRTASEDEFFAILKDAVVTAYYLSPIGLHQDLGYQGNTTLAEFIGTDASDVPLTKPSK
jgi:hypothetical protein